MALLTQKAILSTFEEMLEELPFDKITVSALVRRCGVSSNTFYYHYQDIYDLLDVWMSTRLRHAEEVRPRKQGLEGRGARISQILPRAIQSSSRIFSPPPPAVIWSSTFLRNRTFSFTIMFGNEPPVCRFRRNRSGTLRSSTATLLSVSS